MKGCLVESPGTAPGSEPLITSAFMSIVPKDSFHIGEAFINLKREAQYTGFGVYTAIFCKVV